MIKKIRKFINNIQKDDDVSRQGWYDKVFEWFNEIFFLLSPSSPPGFGFRTIKAFLKFIFIIFCGVFLVLIIIIIILGFYSWIA